MTTNRACQKYFIFHGYLIEQAEDGDVHITYYWTDSQGNDRSWSECSSMKRGLFRSKA